MLRGHFPPSGFFCKRLWDEVDGTPWRGEHSSWKGQMTDSSIFAHPCQSQLRAEAGAFLPLVSLDPSKSLGFELAWAIAKKEGHKQQESKREQVVYSLLQTCTRFSQHAIWFESLLRWKKGSREKTREGGREDQEELQLLGPLNVAFLYGKTSSPAAYKTHPSPTFKSKKTAENKTKKPRHA